MSATHKRGVAGEGERVHLIVVIEENRDQVTQSLILSPSPFYLLSLVEAHGKDIDIYTILTLDTLTHKSRWDRLH